MGMWLITVFSACVPKINIPRVMVGMCSGLTQGHGHGSPTQGSWHCWALAGAEGLNRGAARHRSGLCCRV